MDSHFIYLMRECVRDKRGSTDWKQRLDWKAAIGRNDQKYQGGKDSIVIWGKT